MAAHSPGDPVHRVIVALDFDTAGEAETVVELLGDACGFYKVGLELLTTAGPQLVARLVATGKRVFLDLKLFEIPNSVAGAVRAAGRLGAGMVTVHATGGPRIMEAAVAAAADFPGLDIVALTVVTSLTDGDLRLVGIDGTVDEQVRRLALLALDAGCHGVVASPREAAMLRADLGPDMLIVTPGIELEDAPAANHARRAHPASAFAAGATHIVVGRSLTRSADPAAVLARIHNQLH